MNTFTRSITTTDGINSITTFVIGPAFGPGSIAPKTKETKTMHIAQNDPHHSARERLYYRAMEDHENHAADQRKHFHMDDTDTSKWSWEDFVTAIKTDKFEHRDEKRAKEKGVFNRYNLASFIKFRDPALPPQTEAYIAASEKLDDAYQSILDHIVIADPKDALKKVDEFRSKTFH